MKLFTVLLMVSAAKCILGQGFQRETPHLEDPDLDQRFQAFMQQHQPQDESEVSNLAERRRDKYYKKTVTKSSAVEFGSFSDNSACYGSTYLYGYLAKDANDYYYDKGRKPTDSDVNDNGYVTYGTTDSCDGPTATRISIDAYNGEIPRFNVDPKLKSANMRYIDSNTTLSEIFCYLQCYDYNGTEYDYCSYDNCTLVDKTHGELIVDFTLAPTKREPKYDLTETTSRTGPHSQENSVYSGQERSMVGSVSLSFNGALLKAFSLGSVRASLSKGKRTTIEESD
ncbi:hypothetical protein MPSEU_000620200 [Mayamaea pseudoterrestris]|nr:hypothetical protein MPSEU_000620200 [Mayamaea pseudoterrestris]